MSDAPLPRHPAGNAPEDGDSALGFVCALIAYLCWGLIPLYMKMIAHMPALEVLGHRILWSVPVAVAVLIWQGRTADLRAAFRSPRILAMALLPALLVSANWLIYIWAVSNGHTLDAALGYFINPLFSVLLGALLLGERMRGLQAISIVSAAIGVAVVTWENGSLPLVSLGLMVTWGFYAYLKKSLPLGPNQGFALEVLLLSPLAIGGMLWFAARGESHFLVGNLHDDLVLLFAGVITAVPLIFYGNGAKRLRLSTIGFMQYIAPSIVFLIAVFVFHEPFTRTKLIGFAFIWAGLVFYSVPMLRRRG